MIYPDISVAIALHDEIINQTKGLKGFNQTNIGYLQSALEQIQNDEYYPSIVDKLTHLIFSCVKFHPFNDANKRSSIALGILFLELNNFKEYATLFAYIMEDVVVDLAKDKIDKNSLKNIITNILY